MLPILGPSTVRDTAALPADLWADPWNHKQPVGWRNVGTGLRAIDQRASVLDASNLLEDAALDRYEFIRDGFLQRRESRINDGGASRKEKKAAAAAPAGSNPDGGKLDMKAAYGDDAGTDGAQAKPAAGADVPSGKVDMKAAYGDDADDAAPAAATPATPQPVSK
jgi:phospholipid-binding lipoprotein MlaA